ncbi:MAG: hypothetical protein WBA73_02040 [Devosia sp.]
MFPAASPEPGAPAQAATESRIDIAGIVVVAIYAALQIVLTIAHDPWIDEAQAWLWATAPLTNLADAFIIPGEGHPPLWHWLLRVLSTVLDFTQARYVALVIAIFNAWLLTRLLRNETMLLVLFLGSFTIIQFWGYHFRPYGLVLTCILSALLLDRGGRPIAATWALAVACALHFFAGFLLAFWLVWQLSKGTPVVKLLPPALVAAVFGILAILSGLGNAETDPVYPDLLAGTLYNMGWIGMAEPIKGPLVAALTVVLLVYGLRSKPLLLGTLLVLLVGFAAGTAAVYGKYPWHAAFMTMLCFIAFMVAGLNAERRWILAILLAPQMVFGLIGVSQRLAHPVWAMDNLYAEVVADAGTDFRPERDLVAWPDLAGVTVAAIEDVQLINGNDGTLLGPILWRTHNVSAFAPVLLERIDPYWLICALCDEVTDYLKTNGRQLTLLGTKFNVDNGDFAAYRVD